MGPVVGITLRMWALKGARLLRAALVGEGEGMERLPAGPTIGKGRVTSDVVGRRMDLLSGQVSEIAMLLLIGSGFCVLPGSSGAASRGLLDCQSCDARQKRSITL